jgi:transposase
MGKRKYKATKIQDISHTKLGNELEAGRVVVAIDVAKTKFYAAIVDSSGKRRQIVKWEHPAESREFLALIEQLGGLGYAVEVVMEPTGVYGDAIRASLGRVGVSVFRVSPKRVHDAAEVYDGVPSLHDAKATAIIAKLHLDGLSEPWPLEPERRRRLAAALRILELHEKEVSRNRNRLEALLARYWPGVSSLLALDSASLLELLIEFTGPSQITEQPDEARALLRKVGRHFLVEEKIEAVIESARTNLGVTQLEEEERLVRETTSELRRHQLAARRAKARVEKLVEAEGSVTQGMAQVVGKTTSAVLVAGVGAPTQYGSAAAYVKALGLNLKIRSSGESKGGLHITKRGPGIARYYLYLAVLRLIQHEPVFQAWYAKKLSRIGEKQKQIALTALMRKLARALWHVARGATFDSSRLFDVTRLALTSPHHQEVPPPITITS